jgi:hypothetical protein
VHRYNDAGTFRRGVVAYGAIRVAYDGEAMSAAAALLILAATAAPPVALECPAITGQTLVYIDIYDGPPEKQADLAPDDSKKQPGGGVANIWQLAPGADGLFVKCGYGKKLEGPYSRTEMIRLPDAVKTCRADFKGGAKPDDLVLQKFSCR